MELDKTFVTLSWTCCFLLCHTATTKVYSSALLHARRVKNVSHQHLEKQYPEMLSGVGSESVGSGCRNLSQRMWKYSICENSK
jgi:hypothetical protein